MELVIVKKKTDREVISKVIQKADLPFYIANGWYQSKSSFKNGYSKKRAVRGG